MRKNLLVIGSLLFILTACSSISHHAIEQQSQIGKPNMTAAGYNVQLGMSYLQQGDVTRAKRKLLLALQQAPNWAPAQDAMGYFYETTGDTPRAQQYYLSAVNINPAAGAPQNNYGTFLCRTGRYQEADQHFARAVQDSSYVNTAAAYENAGLCALQIPDNAKALAYFQKAVQQDPKRATSYLEIAQLNFNQNNFAAAQSNYATYSQLTPNPSAEALWLGVRLARQAKDQATENRDTLLLQMKYPNSAEYKQLIATRHLPTPQV